MLWQLLTEFSRVCVITGLSRCTRISVYELMRETSATETVCVRNTSRHSYMRTTHKHIHTCLYKTIQLRLLPLTFGVCVFAFDEVNWARFCMLVKLLALIKPALICH